MKKPAMLTSSWFLYSAGLMLIVVPSMIMGVFGAIGLRELEEQPLLYYREAKQQTNTLKTAMLNALYVPSTTDNVVGTPMQGDDARTFIPEDAQEMVAALGPGTPQRIPGLLVEPVYLDPATGDVVPLPDQGQAPSDSMEESEATEAGTNLDTQEPPSSTKESSGDSAASDTPGGPLPPEQELSRPIVELPMIDAGLLNLEQALWLQYRYVNRRDAIAHAALTFYGDQLLGVVQGDSAPNFVVDPHWQSTLSRTFAEISRSQEYSGFWASGVQAAGQQEDAVALLVTAREWKDQPAPKYWTAWLMNPEVITKLLRERAKGLRGQAPLRFEPMKTTDPRLYDEQVRTALPMDPRVLPMWTLAVYLDESRLPVGGSSWRSVFYTVIGMVGSVILVTVVFLLATRLRRELVEARKKVDFVANVTHELKTPLTSIRMFIEMLVMGRSRSEEDTKQSLEIILRETERLGRLIDRVLDFNKLGRKRKIFNFQIEGIGNVVRETVAIFRNQMRPDGERQVKLAIQSGLPPALMDRDAFREVLLNLLTNAAKYSPSETPIDVRVYQEGRWLVTDIIDRGRGIPLEEQDRIFEKFYRVKDELNRNVEGTGLGLTISQQVMKAHNGTLSVDSRDGHGSRFSAKLPVASKLDETGRAPSIRKVGD